LWMVLNIFSKKFLPSNFSISFSFSIKNDVRAQRCLSTCEQHFLLYEFHVHLQWHTQWLFEEFILRSYCGISIMASSFTNYFKTYNNNDNDNMTAFKPLPFPLECIRIINERNANSVETMWTQLCSCARFKVAHHVNEVTCTLISS
jgi:hypothetical protein